MAYSTPRTWVAGEYPSAAQMNADVRDNVAFLANPPSCRVYKTTNFTHSTSGTSQVVTFDAERWDTAGMHSTSSLTTRITFPVAGLYLVEARAQWDNNAVGVRYIGIRLNGGVLIAVPQINAGVNDAGMEAVTAYKFAANDYVEFVAFQNSGAARALVAAGNYSPEFGATWIGFG